MSEYQYHEWQTVDRLLTPEEQSAVDGLSSHIEVSSSKAVVTYNWGDFKYDPRQVLLSYFDAYFYLANWGTLRLMFRFPIGMIDDKEIAPYLTEYVGLESHGEYQVLDIDINPEDSGWQEAQNAGLSDFIRLRADLLEGDYRLLYLAWLKEMTVNDEPYDDEGDEDAEDDFDEEVIEDENTPGDDFEPPVPAGLKKLTPALQNFVRVFGIDPFLVQAAAEASPDRPTPPAVNFRSLVSALPRSECDDFLTRLAEGDAATGLALRKRLNKLLPQQKPLKSAGTRSIQQLIARAEQLEEIEEKLKADQARRQHIAAMKSLAGRENQAWLDVEKMIEEGTKSASVYESATNRLEQLQQLAEFQDTRDIFLSKVLRLAEKFASRTSLIARWKKHGWF
jgi:hypothetical protein